MKIMDIKTIQDDQARLQRISEDITEAKANLDLIINKFESDPTVQSFYVSGNFGKESQERLIKLRDGLAKYEASINGDGALVPITKSFLDKQEERVNNGEK